LSEVWRPPDPASYSYLLGIYLGDGYVAQETRSPVLEISLDRRYPGIVEECSAAIWRILQVRARASIRATPAISLTSWQQEVVDRFPGQFLRGLIHSDGSRVVNRFTINLPSGAREYAYVRYFLTNLSTDISGLFCATCDQLGIRWTRSSHKNISIADRRSIELLDSFVGPKIDAGGGI
jgi:hypothetical protein